MNVNDLLRKHIKSIKAYSTARAEFSGQASVFLDANENALAAGGYNRYPDPLQMKLRQRIAELKKIDVGHIFLGNGSDEVIDLLIRAFCEPARDQIITLPPTYGMYQVAADINNINIKEVALDENFQPDVGRILNEMTAYTRILFICSPNNPTGNLVKRELVLKLASSFTGIVVLDEAYIDFAAPGSSALSLLEQFPNLVILQTFSKAWGLAGIRLGMAFASKKIITILNKIKLPYNVNEFTQQHALEALKQEALVARWIEETIVLRELLRNELTEVACVRKVFDSDANFLLVQVRDAAAVYAFLLQKGIVVRDRSGQPGCSDCLRVTVGTAQENRSLVQAFKEFND